MAKKSFKLKVKSCLWANVKLMYFVTIALFVITLELSIFYNYSPILPMVTFLGIIVVKYLIVPTLEELDIDGVEEVSIDHDMRCIKFDNQRYIPFDDISYACIKNYSSTYISISMLDSFVSLVSVSAELIIGFHNSSRMIMNVQRRDSMKGLIQELKKFTDVQLKHDDRYKEKIQVHTDFLLVLVLLALIVYCLFHFNVL